MGPGVVVFYIVAGDLEISDLGAFDADSSESVVADMATVNIDLVEVDVIQKHPCPSIVIDVTASDEYVSVSPGQENSMSETPEAESAKGGLKRSLEFDPIRFTVSAVDEKVTEERGLFGFEDGR